MTKQGFLAFDGHVTHVHQGGLVYVTLDNNGAMLAKVCGNYATAPWDSCGTGRSRPRGRVAV